ncbi:type IV pilus secretin PilQ [Halomonas sp. WWR20]
MRRYLRNSLSGLLALAWLVCGQALAASALTELDFTQLAGGQLRAVMTFEGGVPEVKGYRIDSPPRLALDLMGTHSRLERQRFALDIAGVQQATVLEAGGRTRLVFNLDEPLAYTTRQEEDRVIVTLGVDAGHNASSGSATTTPVPPTQGGPRIEDLDFRRGPDGEGRIVVRLNRSGLESRVREQGDSVLVELRGVRLPAELDQVLDVSDFGTPVQRIVPHAGRNGTTLELENTGNYLQMATHTGRELVIEVKPLNDREQAERLEKRFPYTGERITLNFQDIEVRSVLGIIADFTGLNLVASDSVEGSVTLNLQEVPWDQALDLILKSHGLASRRTGDVLVVAPAQELAAMERQALESQAQNRQLAPLTTEFVQVRYAKAEALATLLRGMEGVGLMSERGRVTVDLRTNTLLIQDTREQIEAIRRTIDYLDVPVRQVQIEARIVIARDSAAKELGVSWGASAADGINGILGRGSSLDLSGAAAGSVGNGGLSVDLGDAASPSNAFSFGYLSGDVLIDLELSALESEGKSQTISQPKIITANQQTALIKQGKEIPYEESAGDGATSISFKEAVLSLEVTPQITPDNRIIMDLVINNDAVSDDSYGGEPAIDTNEIQTQVLVNNGETVVLGGILTSEQLHTLFKTPFFGDLPFVGNLFRYTDEANEKVELLVFITPKIIEDNLAIR